MQFDSVEIDCSQHLRRGMMRQGEGGNERKLIKIAQLGGFYSQPYQSHKKGNMVVQKTACSHVQDTVDAVKLQVQRAKLAVWMHIIKEYGLCTGTTYLWYLYHKSTI